MNFLQLCNDGPCARGVDKGRKLKVLDLSGQSVQSEHACVEKWIHITRARMCLEANDMAALGRQD